MARSRRGHACAATAAALALAFTPAAAQSCPEPGSVPVRLTEDTNLSAKEAYSILRSALASPGCGRALDLGAGAGYSSRTLHGLGYTDAVHAVDPSGAAWALCGYASHLPNVTFFEMTDEAFSEGNPLSMYDAVSIAYGVSTGKANRIAAKYLKAGGRMLAPIENGSCMGIFTKSKLGELSLLGKHCGWAWQHDATGSCTPDDL